MSLKVASPPTAVTVKVPESVSPPALFPRASVMLSVALETKLPPTSCTRTLMAGEMAAPACASDGSTLKTNWVASPLVKLTVALSVIGVPLTVPVTVAVPVVVAEVSVAV